jgi:FMN phosphatase YigB (HAD superfamily)
MEPASRSIRGVIFDLDGTLYVMRWRLQLYLFFALFPRGVRLPGFLAVRQTCAGIDFQSRERLLDEISGKLALRAKISPPEALRWIDQSFYLAFINVMRHFRRSRSGLSEFLTKLRSHRVKLAVLSDYGRVVERLEKLGIKTALFDSIASCEDAGALKPHTRPFLEIAREWGIYPSEIVVVGDRTDTDGIAAKSAGMQFVHVSDARHMPAGAKRWSGVVTELMKRMNPTASALPEALLRG